MEKQNINFPPFLELFFFSFLLFTLCFLSAEISSAEVTVTAEVLIVCGNSIVESGEQCDDGNTNSGDGCSSFCQSEVSPPSPGGGGGGGGGGPALTTKVVLQGKAYPLAKITVLKDGKLAIIIAGDSQANFKAEFSDITPGVFSFGLWAEDKEERKSITFSFTLTVNSNMITTVSGIFIPPTVELEKVNLARGENLTILGQTAPESQLSIHIESPQEIIKKTTAKESGDWSFLFDTNPLDEGSHTIRAKAEDQAGLISSFSKVLAFYVGKYGTTEIYPKADFNKDGKTNLTDFSIMLYWWGKYNPAVDMNQDGILNLPDFSILMYYWTG